MPHFPDAVQLTQKLLAFNRVEQSVAIYTDLIRQWSL